MRKKSNEPGYRRSSRSSTSPTAAIGTSTSETKPQTSTDHANIGRLLHVIPSARRYWIVATRFPAEQSTESASRSSPISQRSTPCPSCVSTAGGYPAQPASEEPPLAKAERTTAAPPKPKSHSDIAARPGFAIPVAPIISGTRNVARPTTTGTKTKKTSIVPCIVRMPA